MVGLVVAALAATILPAVEPTAVASAGAASLATGLSLVARHQGYWLVTGGGRVLGYGDARSFGSDANAQPHPAVVGMAATPDGLGYWLVTGAGRVLSYGDARSFGSGTNAQPHPAVVGMAATPDGLGYWLVTCGGKVLSYGDARSFGSGTNAQPHPAVVGMAATPDGLGYWLVTSGGKVLSYGDARSFGSDANAQPHPAVVGMAATPDGLGYWLVTGAGRVLSYGDARSFGSGTNAQPHPAVVGMAATPDGLGYWLVTGAGRVLSYGDARSFGSGTAHRSDPLMVAMAVLPPGPPVLAGIEDSARSYQTGSPAVPVTSSITVSTSDGTDLTKARAAISSGYLHGRDSLSFNGAHKITGTFNAATGVLTLKGKGTASAYQAALRSVKFSTAGSTRSGPRTVSFQVDDGRAVNHASNVLSRALSVVHPAPVVTTTAGQSGYTQGQAPVVIDGGVKVKSPSGSDSDVRPGRDHDWVRPWGHPGVHRRRQGHRVLRPGGRRADGERNSYGRRLPVLPAVRHVLDRGGHRPRHVEHCSLHGQ